MNQITWLITTVAIEKLVPQAPAFLLLYVRYPHCEIHTKYRMDSLGLASETTLSQERRERKLNEVFF